MYTTVVSPLFRASSLVVSLTSPICVTCDQTSITWQNEMACSFGVGNFAGAEGQWWRWLCSMPLWCNFRHSLLPCFNMHMQFFLLKHIIQKTNSRTKNDFFFAIYFNMLQFFLLLLRCQKTLHTCKKENGIFLKEDCGLFHPVWCKKWPFHSARVASFYHSLSYEPMRLWHAIEYFSD
jgi:hypothetical protein